MSQSQDVRQTPIPGFREPVDVAGSVGVICCWVGLGAVAGVLLFVGLGGTTGALAALACLGAGAWIGHERSDAVSDSDRWRAREARRRGVWRERR